MDFFELGLVYSILFLASTVQGLAGFGSALISVPILTFFFPLSFVTPFVILNSFVLNCIILWRNCSGFRVSNLAPLVVGTLLGVPVGVWGLVYLDESLVKKILAVIIFLYGVYSLLEKYPKIQLSRRWGYVFGFFSGCFGGAFNFNGPPVVVYASMTNWSKDEIITTMQSFFIVSGIILLSAHGLNGSFTKDLLSYWVMAAPAVLLGVFLGTWAYRKVDQILFRKIIYLLLIALSGALAFG